MKITWWTAKDIDYWISILTMSHISHEVKVRMIKGSIQMALHEFIWGERW